MNGAIVSAFRFGVWGVLAMGVFLLIKHATGQKEQPHAQKSNDEPYILHVVNECAICLEKFSDQDENMKRRRMILPACGHQFHKGCVDGLRRAEHTRCPLCQKSFVKEA